MAIPAQSRWWIATLFIVGVLVLISALALDQPDVVWGTGADGAGPHPEPHCPLCRTQVEAFSHRCRACKGEFDWVVCPEEKSPICSDSLSVLQAEWVADRIRALGPEASLARVQKATGLRAEMADAYLHSVGRGDCGWCGGTKVDLSSDKPLQDAEPCPACLGTGRCTGCDGDRRARLGDQSAAQALAAYWAEIRDLHGLDVPIALDKRRAEIRRLAETFLKTHSGTVEAQEILFWPEADGADENATIARACRQRLESVIRHLEMDD